MKKNAQRETTLRPPLRRRCAMVELLTPLRDCGGCGISISNVSQRPLSQKWRRKPPFQTFDKGFSEEEGANFHFKRLTKACLRKEWGNFQFQTFSKASLWKWIGNFHFSRSPKASVRKEETSILHVYQRPLRRKEGGNSHFKLFQRLLWGKRQVLSYQTFRSGFFGDEGQETSISNVEQRPLWRKREETSLSNVYQRPLWRKEGGNFPFKRSPLWGKREETPVGTNSVSSSVLWTFGREAITCWCCLIVIILRLWIHFLLNFHAWFTFDINDCVRQRDLGRADNPDNLNSARGTWNLESVRGLSDWKSDPSIPETFVGRAFIIGVENSDMSDDNWECRARSVFPGQQRSHQHLEELRTMCSKKAGMFVRPSGVPWLLVGRKNGGDVSQRIPGVPAGALWRIESNSYSHRVASGVVACIWGQRRRTTQVRVTFCCNDVRCSCASPIWHHVGRTVVGSLLRIGWTKIERWHGVYRACWWLRVHSVNSTPNRAHLSRATHAIFLVCKWLKFWSPARDRIVRSWFLRVLKVIPSHPCVTAPCLTHSCVFTSRLRFLHLHLFVCLSIVVITIDESNPLPLCKEGCALADWLNNHLSRVMSPSLSSKSTAKTLFIAYLRERAVSTRTLTILRPLWMRWNSTTQLTMDGWLHNFFLRSAK